MPSETAYERSHPGTSSAGFGTPERVSCNRDALYHPARQSRVGSDRVKSGPCPTRPSAASRTVARDCRIRTGQVGKSGGVDSRANDGSHRDLLPIAIRHFHDPVRFADLPPGMTTSRTVNKASDPRSGRLPYPTGADSTRFRTAPGPGWGDGGTDGRGDLNSRSRGEAGSSDTKRIAKSAGGSP
jgi:hypothetical protein